jgi:hypothetical protein
MDLFVHADSLNASRIIAALTEFGFGSVGLSTVDFEKTNMVIQLGVPPIRVDIITSLTGLTWEETWAHRVAGRYGEVSVFFLGREQFITNKRAVGRKRHLADLEALGEE